MQGEKDNFVDFLFVAERFLIRTGDGEKTVMQAGGRNGKDPGSGVVQTIPEKDKKRRTICINGGPCVAE